MQQAILDAILQSNNITTEEGAIAYLQRLQEPARQLWNAFRAFPVRVEYERRDYQSVYMVRYFPIYSWPIRYILSALHHNPGHLPFGGPSLVASFIGAGPSPEVLGFIAFLHSTAYRPNSIRLNTFDIRSEAWAYSRRITFEKLLPLTWPHCTIDSSHHDFNLFSDSYSDNDFEIFSNSNLLVLQNCLNEVPDQFLESVKSNLRRIISKIPSDAIVLVIDLLNYPPVLELLQDLEEEFLSSPNVSILRSTKNGSRRIDAQNLVNSIPSIVRAHLLTGIAGGIGNGLIPRRYLDYHHFAIKKT